MALPGGYAGRGFRAGFDPEERRRSRLAGQGHLRPVPAGFSPGPAGFALRPGVSSDLRQKAIFWIGQGDDPDRVGFLKTLFTQLRDTESRDKILFSMSQVEGRESQRWLLGVAGDVNENIELRKKALFWAGQSDIPGAELFTLYEKMPSREMKEQLIFVYSQRDERAAVDKLFEIARTEPDMELRKKAIFWLGQSDDPRAAGFLERLIQPPA